MISSGYGNRRRRRRVYPQNKRVILSSSSSSKSMEIFVVMTMTILMIMLMLDGSMSWSWSRSSSSFFGNHHNNNNNNNNNDDNNNKWKNKYNSHQKRKTSNNNNGLMEEKNNKKKRKKKKRFWGMNYVYYASAKAYPEGCSKQSPSYYDYDNYPYPPSSSSNLSCRCPDDYLLLRRLGSGKFSDVFEAVDVKLQESFWKNGDDRDGMDFDSIDSRTLCVIKCLKPVSERKIKRELLVLSHASQLPNLARLRAFVLPNSENTTSDDDEEEDEAAAAAALYTTATTTNNNNVVINAVKNNNNTNKKKIVANPNEMPSLVLEHAGPHSQWFCHGKGNDNAAVAASTTSFKNSKIPPTHLVEYEIQYYLCHLLVALDALHSRGIMHRDVKPRNVLINRSWPPPTAATLQKRQQLNLFNDDNNLDDDDDDDTFVSSDYNNNNNNNNNGYDYDYSPLMLIDLGLADFYLPNQSYNVRVASRHYKAPELLIGNEYYDYGLDLWGVGCILAGLLFRREPFFRGKDNVDQLGKIVSILGKNDLMEYCQRCDIILSENVQNVVDKYTMRYNPMKRRKPWGVFFANTNTNKKNEEENCPIPSALALDLLDKLLVYDHTKRYTAKEAMMHPFFDKVRHIVKEEVRARYVSTANGNHISGNDNDDNNEKEKTDQQQQNELRTVSNEINDTNPKKKEGPFYQKAAKKLGIGKNNQMN